MGKIVTWIYKMIKILSAPINIEEFEKYINEIQNLISYNWVDAYRKVYGEYVFNPFKFTQLIGSNRIGTSQSVKILTNVQGDKTNAVAITITDLDFLTSKTKETLIYCVGETLEAIQEVKEYLLNTKEIAKVDEVWEYLPLADLSILLKKIG
jgi:hypothetical protein